MKIILTAITVTALTTAIAAYNQSRSDVILTDESRALAEATEPVQHITIDEDTAGYPGPIVADRATTPLMITETTPGYPGPIVGELKQFIEITEHTPGYPGPIVAGGPTLLATAPRATSDTAVR